MIDASIIIVSYNTAELTCAAISSVYEQTCISKYEVIVIDNDSIDGSADRISKEFPDCRLFRIDSNIGFAAANNLAAEQARGRYILLLNPDTLVLEGAIDKIIAFADNNPEYGVYGGSTFFGDMSRNPTAGWNMTTMWSLFSTAIGFSSIFRNSSFFNPESLAWWDWTEPRTIDIVTGCFFLIRTDLWNQLGGFDLQFYMYGEDADLCLRVKEVGKRCVLYPGACIIHYGGASETVRSDKMTRLLKAKIQLFQKHWSPLKATYAKLMLKLWSLSRACAFRTLYRNRPNAKDSFEAWREIWRRRLEWSGRYE
ncbi:glycosyltransferase family 2 protein [Marispirochaeta aestuarii]|uniref:glycosyltransferase family 2 protein n=1 Tax=Marispirochaeta aestuarii TaxID=1963862 RepID=UPI002ABDD87C|nr:glycosyltransferase family 2 protein [Marispirochaeta aestuarii]